MKVVAQGYKFEFSISCIRRGVWVYRLVSIDGEPNSDYGSDPFPTERECRKWARHLAENGYMDRVYGWCAK